MEDINNWQEKYVNCKYAERLLNKLTQMNQQVNRPIDINEVKKAVYYAKKYHGSQMRQSGEPYYSHPIEVAYMISDYLYRTDILVISILHDTIEDTELSEKMIAMVFGNQVADQVMDLTRIKEDGRKISSAEIMQLLHQQKKYDTLIIKLFDRLHNMQTIGAKSQEKTKKTIKETLKYFLVFCEIMELPWLCEMLYEKCCISNITLDVAYDNLPILNKPFKLSDVPFFQNKTLP